MKSPQELVKGPHRAPGTVTIRRIVIPTAIGLLIVFFGIMLGLAATHTQSLAAAANHTNNQDTTTDAQPASVSDLVAHQQSHALPTAAAPLPSVDPNTNDAINTNVSITAPPEQSLAQAAPEPPAPTVDPEKLAAIARHEHEAAIREASLNSEVMVPIDTVRTIRGQGKLAPIMPTSKTMLMRGMIIPVTLMTSIDSTLPGIIVGMVSQDVYDARHQRIVIPRGSRVTGTYASGALAGQRRISIAWDEIQFADNRTIMLDSMPGVDLSGTSGFGAAVDEHTRQLFRNVLLLSALGAGAQLSQPRDGANCVSSSCATSLGQAAAASVGQNLTQTGTAIIERNANIEPTLHVVEGAQVAIMVVHDIALDPVQAQP